MMQLTEFSVSQVVPVPVEQAFDRWMDPTRPGGPWYGGKKTIVNPVVDGLFYIAAESEGREWAHYGRFVAIDRPRRVEFTWMSEVTRGAESVVTVTFEPRGDETEVTLRHAGVPDDEMGRQHKEGWAWVLSMLAQALGAKAQ